jgi:hypothetical protein
MDIGNQLRDAHIEGFIETIKYLEILKPFSDQFVYINEGNNRDII